jgi:dihydrofolate reductase
VRKLIVTEFMTLDGVAQAPSYPDEDTDGGFVHGGWNTPYLDEASQQWVIENVTQTGAFLFGRRTYEIFAAHWPNASDEEQVLAEPLNARPKYVVSTTLTEPLVWQNSTLLHGDVPEVVCALKREGGGGVTVIGSTQLIQSLIAHDLVDEFRLMIDPIVVGGGKRIFHDDGPRRVLQLVDSRATATGATLATYARVT